MAFPRVKIFPQAAKRLRNFDCWVFRDELATHDQITKAGDVVEVLDGRGQFVAYAFYNPRAHIALRVVSLLENRSVDVGLFQERLRQALARREAIRNTNARRLVFSEADGLPGLIVDQYDRWLVVQFRSAGMDRLRPTILALLRDVVPCAGILERSDKEFRADEGLEPVTRVQAGTVPERILIHEDDLQFWVDPHRGLKTGFYLDQRPTRRHLTAWVEPDQRVLDAFS